MFHWNYLFIYSKGGCSAWIPHPIRLTNSFIFYYSMIPPSANFMKGKIPICGQTMELLWAVPLFQKVLSLAESKCLCWPLKTISFPTDSASCFSALSSTLNYMKTVRRSSFYLTSSVKNVESHCLSMDILACNHFISWRPNWYWLAMGDPRG